MAKLKGIPRPENAVKVKHLLKVEGDANNNKYYDMYDTGDGNFIAFYGRVGADPQIEQYPIYKWDTKYREKLSSRKGYTDITHLRTEAKASIGFKDITDSQVAAIVSQLQAYANNLVQQTYLVTAGAVTLAQVTEAQNILNELLLFVNDPGYTSYHPDRFIRDVNDVLTKLFTVIPRKMKNVKDHLLSVKNEDQLRNIITDEQDNLDTMEGQVKAYQLQQQNTDTNITLLDAMGMQFSAVDNGVIGHIKQYMGPNANQFRRAFKVINLKTQKRFDECVTNASNKTIKEFWHGSRNQNWWSILGGGLVLHPTSAVITGKMFGYGLYFANKAKKSIGYTSLTGSYWARGSENRAYLALFNVHTGNEYRVKRHQSEMRSFTYKHLRNRGDYDCMFVEGGYDLYNDEIIVYQENQATVSYVIEISN